MASIFLSYARDDGAKATRIAQALEAAGHSVWWDRHIGTGSRFSAEIDEALRKAELVVVLWSQRSIQSAWVLDEAAVGRDSGRLVPVTIDETLPPLGFRQFQALPLAGSLRGARSIQPLLDAVADGVKAGPGPGPPSVVVRKSKSFLPRWAMVAVVALTLVGLAWLLVGRDQDSGGATTIVVAAAEGGDGARSRDFARSIAVDLGRYRAGPAGTLVVVDGSSTAARNADYRFDVGLSAGDKDVRADVSLQSADRGRLLWSAAVESAERPLADVRQEVASKIGDVLRCLAEMQQSGRTLNPDVQRLYLSGCSIQEPTEEAISIFRQITRQAPDFGGGWAHLALIKRRKVPTATLSERRAMFDEIRDHLKRAKALAPDLPETIAADALFRRNDAARLPAAIAILDRGIARNPDSALLRGLRSEQLYDAGLVRDAIGEATRASELDPLSIALRDNYISALAYGGRAEEAFEHLKRAESIWPGSVVLRKLRFRLSLRFGDPRESLALLATSGPNDSTADPANEAWRLFLEARAEPRTGKVEAALANFRARYSSDPFDVLGYLQALGTFGRIDEAYRAMAAPEALDSMMAFGNPHIFFRPYMRSFRADRRFIALAAKLGLLQFWEANGTWPDFCSDPQLPYDCKAEAAKLTPEQRKPARFLS